MPNHVALREDAETRVFPLSSIHEAKPGPKWQALFEHYWPQYKQWFLSQGQQERPGYVTSSKKLAAYMPELMPIYTKLVALAGGGDLAARFLTFYRPPPYLLGCSQASWLGTPPTLARNYDYSPILSEWTLLYTSWLRPVIAMSDCMWGVLDGINDAGLAVSLAFGGNKKIGDGFGVPLILRYILEVCDDVSEACEVLRHVQVHMSYNISLLDAAGNHNTVYTAPDRKPYFLASQVATNHQDRIDWPAYARMSASIERRTFLERQLASPWLGQSEFVHSFFRPPIFRTQYERAFGTLYTAVYDCANRSACFYWPTTTPLKQSFAHFTEGDTRVALHSNSWSTPARPWQRATFNSWMLKHV